MAVFIDSVTGELKYQGTSGTPGVIASEDGYAPFSQMEVRYPIVSAITEIDSNTFSGIGNIVFDPSVLFAGNSKVTRIIQLRTIVSTSSGVTCQFKLYNLTLGADVASTTSTSSASSPTEYTSVLTINDNLVNSSNMYELQLRISVPTEASPGDYAICQGAAIVVTYS